jgi:hypothetical protein
MRDGHIISFKELRGEGLRRAGTGEWFTAVSGEVYEAKKYLLMILGQRMLRTTNFFHATFPDIHNYLQILPGLLIAQLPSVVHRPSSSPYGSTPCVAGN